MISYFFVAIGCHRFVIVSSTYIVSVCASQATVTKVKPVLTTTMHLCLKLDEILDMILLKLSLKTKFSILAVSRKWREKGFVVLRRQKSVVLSCNTPDRLYIEPQCKNHPVTRNNVITCVQHMNDFWKAVFSYLPGIKYVYLDSSSKPTGGTCYGYHYNLVMHVIDEYGSQLECLWIPGYKAQYFPEIPILPQLRDLHFMWLTDDDVQHILNCPKLEYLKCDTKFTKWNFLPKGFKSLEGDENKFEGLNSLLVSPAAETIEEIKVMQLTSEALFGNFWLPCLRVLHVEINKAPNGCLKSLARILRFSPGLTEFTLKIQSMQKIKGVFLSRVIEQCTRVTHFKLYMNLINGNYFKVNSWQDDFAWSMALNMKNLKHLDVDFALSSTGLTALSSLPQLEFFRHKLHQERGVDNIVFSKDALYSFLRTQFSHKLSHYEIEIRIFGDDSCLKVTQEFADGLITMAQDLPLKIILQILYRVGGLTCMFEKRLRKRGMNYQKIKEPGTVYATKLKIDTRCHN